MNRITIAVAVAATLFAAPAFAQTVSGSQSGAYSQSGVYLGGSPKQAPNAIAPGLIASGLSCSGSTSIGGAGAGWGISLGITKEDKNCNAREDAKYISALTGNNAAAKARLCSVKDNRDAFRLAGDPCPQDAVRSASTSPELRSSQPAVRQTRIRSFSSITECQRWVKANGVNAQCKLR